VALHHHLQGQKQIKHTKILVGKKYLFNVGDREQGFQEFPLNMSICGAVGKESEHP
jgi:hypothetical protein